MILESLVWFIAGIYNFFFLIYVLIKYPRKIWIIPVINTVGVLMILIIFFVAMVPHPFYAKYIATIDITGYIYPIFKFVSICLAVYTVLKIKK